MARNVPVRTGTPSVRSWSLKRSYSAAAFTGSAASRKLGRRSTLAALRVAPALVDRAAQVVGRYPEVTHSYLRDHPFNIWFTLIAADDARIETILREIRAELSLEESDVLDLPVKRMFKLDARFRPRP